MIIRKLFSGIEKADVIKTVKDEITFSYQYFVMLVLSVIIATLGLLLANTAIIIGAMIISPMIWPIIGLSTGTVTSRRGVFLNSIILLFMSIVISIFIAYIISVFSPFAELNSEISLRVNPTFFDLIIALAAGTAAILIISWPQYSNQLAGVAVAASVLPPICVTGIGLALGSPKVAMGSFILFLTNMASIVFIGIALFTIMGLYKKNDEEQVKKIEFGLLASFIVILLLSFQLLFALNTIIYEENVKTKIRQTLRERFSEVSTGITVDAVTTNTVTRSSDIVDVKATLKVPSDVQINVEQKNQIVDALAENIGKDINLELQILPVLKVISEDENAERNEEEEVTKAVQKIITTKVKSISSSIIVESVTISLEEDLSVAKYSVETILRVPENEDISEDDKDDIIFDIIKELNRPVTLNVIVVRYERI